MSNNLKKATPDKRVVIASLMKTLTREKIVAMVLITSDAVKRGELLFKTAKCANCHTTNSNATPKGPSLADAARRFKPDPVVDSILTPSKVISQEYGGNLFELENGNAVVGFISKTTADQIEVRGTNGDAAKNQNQRER